MFLGHLFSNPCRMTGPSLHDGTQYGSSETMNSSHGLYPPIKSSRHDSVRWEQNANRGTHRISKDGVRKRPTPERKTTKTYTHSSSPSLGSYQDYSSVHGRLSSMEKKSLTLEQRLAVLENDWGQRWIQLQKSIEILSKQQDSM
jgi:hypothetical protein